MTMLACPYCQQEYVWEIELKLLNRRAVMCFECDTVWDTVEEVQDSKGCSFDDFMAKLGVAADWKLVGKVQQIAN
jgi:hypothetical protein